MVAHNLSEDRTTILYVYIAYIEGLSDLRQKAGNLTPISMQICPPPRARDIPLRVFRSELVFKLFTRNSSLEFRII